MSIAVCPGSFDPVTLGHLDIIKRASSLFDTVIVLVSVNPSKHCSFSVEERVSLIEQCIKDLPNVKVDFFTGLLVEYMKNNNASVIVKGLRAMSDFEYEFQQALANKSLYNNAETVFLTTSPENMYLSSSLVRQIAGFNGDIKNLVPEKILERVTQRLNPK